MTELAPEDYPKNRVPLAHSIGTAFIVSLIYAAISFVALTIVYIFGSMSIDYLGTTKILMLLAVTTIVSIAFFVYYLYKLRR